MQFHVLWAWILNTRRLISGGLSTLGDHIQDGSLPVPSCTQGKTAIRAGFCLRQLFGSPALAAHKVTVELAIGAAAEHLTLSLPARLRPVKAGRRRKDQRQCSKRKTAPSCP